jgi:hypothetical protein
LPNGAFVGIAFLETSLMKPRPHPAAQPHGPIAEVLPDVFFVTGSFRFPGFLPVVISRNMTIVREGERLVLINSVRLSDAGLAELDRLGHVTDVIRLAGNHGSDDPFYKERYGAKVWALGEQPYIAGFDLEATPYFEPDHRTDGKHLPLAGARLLTINSTPEEGLLLLDRERGILIAGDALQNWATTDAHFNGLGRFVSKRFGFIKPQNIGPGWLRQCKPPAGDLRALLDLPFEHVLPAHGTPVKGNARELYRSAIESAATRLERATKS